MNVERYSDGVLVEKMVNPIDRWVFERMRYASVRMWGYTPPGRRGSAHAACMELRKRGLIKGLLRGSRGMPSGLRLTSEGEAFATALLLMPDAPLMLPPRITDKRKAVA